MKNNPDEKFFCPSCEKETDRWEKILVFPSESWNTPPWEPLKILCCSTCHSQIMNFLTDVDFVIKQVDKPARRYNPNSKNDLFN